MKLTWPERWQIKSKELLTVDWSAFRRNTNLMRRLEDSSTKENVALATDVWIKRAQKYGVPLRYWQDSMVGQPPDTTRIGGVEVTLISLRMATHAHRIETLWRAKSDWANKPVTVMEIGGGFGSLAYALAKRMPVALYILIDNPVCLEIQRKFLEEAHPELFANCVFISEPTFSTEFFRDINLIVNTHSLGEMTHEEVATYFELIHKTLNPGGAFYSVNRDIREVSFHEYPYDQYWKHEVFEFGIRMIECLSVRDLTADSKHPLRKRCAI